MLGLCCLLVACSTVAQTNETVATSPSPDVAPSPDVTTAPRVIPSFDGDSESVTTTNIDDASMLIGPGQVLPITAQATIAGETFDLEVAKTREEQQLGLMHRNALPDDRGMLFPFSPARPVAFWMKNVPVGLDMVFLYQGGVQGIAQAAPCEAEPCPTYGPGRLLVDNVIELRIGRAAELGLELGDEVDIVYLEE